LLVRAKADGLDAASGSADDLFRMLASGPHHAARDRSSAIPISNHATPGTSQSGSIETVLKT